MYRWAWQKQPGRDWPHAPHGPAGAIDNGPGPRHPRRQTLDNTPESEALRIKQQHQFYELMRQRELDDHD